MRFFKHKYNPKEVKSILDEIRKNENIFIDNYEKTVYYNNLIEKMLSTGTSVSVVNIIKKELLENKY